MRRANSILLASFFAGWFICSAGWAMAASADPGSPKDTKAPKEKHWSGLLVDVGCMNKALGAESTSPPQGSMFGAPHLMGWGAALPQKTLDHAPYGNVVPASEESFASPGQQQPGQPGQQGTQPAPTPRGPEPMPGTTERLPDPTSAAEARANKVNDAAKVCAASSSTETVGLATGEGQVLNFDSAGIAKAKAALKSADLQPGKQPKAKVTGTLQDQSTVMVASIEMKRAGKQALQTVIYVTA